MAIERTCQAQFAAAVSVGGVKPAAPHLQLRQQLLKLAVIEAARPVGIEHAH
jgi:hypothetical protein